MAFTFSNNLLLLTALAVALITGLFYGWSCSVLPGLARLSDAAFIAAMQAMNQAIQNPVFFVSFLGSALLLPWCCYVHYHTPVSGRFFLLLAATALYLAGVMGVTIFGNIPLNNALDAFDLSTASPAEIAHQRTTFVARWTLLHTIRTFACTGSLVLVLLACLSGRVSSAI